MIKKSLFSAALLAASVAGAQAGSVDVFLSAPFTQTAQTSGAPDGNGNFAAGYGNAIAETFNSVTGGNYSSLNSPSLSFDTTSGQAITPTASFSSPGTFAVKGNDQFGGGGQGSYLGVSNAGITTLQLSAPVGYIGLEWLAVDGGNDLTLYDQNNNVIGTFNAGSFSALLANNATITAIDGTVYNTADYLGQPTGVSATGPRADASEYFAFVNFIAQPGTLISKIVLSQGGGAIFESDNYAILTDAPNAPLGSFVGITSVPEPSTWAAVALGVGGLGLLAVRRRQAA